MARPRRDDAEHWPLTEHSNGYIQNRNGVAVARFDRYSLSLTMPFVRANKPRAIARANEWVQSIKDKRRGIVTVVISNRRVRSVHQVINEYTAAQLKALHAPSAAAWDDACKSFFPADMPLVAEDIQQHLVERLRVLPSQLAPRTLTQRAGRINTFLAWCHACGYLSSNPFARVKRPEPDDRKDVEIYTERQMLRMIVWCRQHEYVERELLGRLLYLTGMRIGEALSLRWERHIKRDRILINSSIRSWDSPDRGTKTGKKREFPLDAFPEVRQVLDDIAVTSGTRRGYLFSIRAVETPYRWMIAMLRDLNIPKPKRAVHALRTTRINDWERQGMSLQLIADISGHDRRTLERYYRSDQKAPVLAAKIKAERR